MTMRLPVPEAPTLVRVDLLAGLESTLGRRVVLAALEGPQYGWRAVSEPYADGGDPWVDVVPEASWWRWRLLAAPLAPVRWPSGCAWLEMTPAA